MSTLANSMIRGPMSDEQRRAMFARLRGGRGGSRGSRKAADDSSSTATDSSTADLATPGMDVLTADYPPQSFKKDINAPSGSPSPSQTDTTKAPPDYQPLLEDPSRPTPVDSPPVEDKPWYEQYADNVKTAIGVLEAAALIYQVTRPRGSARSAPSKTEEVIKYAADIAALTTPLGATESAAAKAIPAIEQAAAPVLESMPTLENLNAAMNVRHARAYSESYQAAAEIEAAAKAARITRNYKTAAVNAGKTGASIAAAIGIDKYREDHPDMDPRTEKILAMAQTVAEYAAAIYGVKTATQLGKAMMPGTVEKAQRALRATGEKLQSAGEASTEWIPEKIKKPIRAAHGGYTKLADITGFNMTDLFAKGRDITTLVKKIAVPVAVGAKYAAEEYQISTRQKEIEAAWARGEDYTQNAPPERSTFESIMATIAGTLGNPIEKQFRYGNEQYVTQVAAYRAHYDAIGRAEAAGDITANEAHQARTELAKYKPKNMAGKSIWTVAPATAAFVSWKAKELADYFKHSVEVGTVTHVVDGDTVDVTTSDGTTKRVRFMGVDTPESVHPNKPTEYLGPEASSWQKDNLTGKRVRVVKSDNQGTEKWGRDIGYIETLPGALDYLYDIPGVGKWIPGIDQNLKTIEQGYGQPRYLELSGGHDRQREYDYATAEAKRQQIGVHSPKGMQQLDYHYQTYDEKRGRTTPPPDTELQKALGLGLMGTGQTGVFKSMGPAGNITAQAWNAILAGLGTKEYNDQARYRTDPIVAKRPKIYETSYDKQLRKARENDKQRKRKN